jgi:hypothetical protein
MRQPSLTLTTPWYELPGIQGLGTLCSVYASLGLHFAGHYGYSGGIVATISPPASQNALRDVQACALIHRLRAVMLTLSTRIRSAIVFNIVWGPNFAYFNHPHWHRCWMLVPLFAWAVIRCDRTASVVSHIPRVLSC